MDSKTYSLKNLKFVLIQLFILIFAVSILLYLFSLRGFTPMGESGEYIWLNIFAFGSLLFISLFSFSSLISYFLLRIVLRKEDCRILKIVCIKWGLLFTFGIFLVVLLNFFHVLSIYWGLGILTVVILASFVI